MTSTVICFHSGLLIFCNSSKLAMKQNIIQICNCRIYILMIQPYASNSECIFHHLSTGHPLSTFSKSQEYVVHARCKRLTGHDQE